ncbi:hypothetical protein Vretimale_15108 [Volvox reticuliferus]|uniref:Uncharacterized protein n=1 Tax=Volvox reticuliferus TaxID=1737510 RepID=A0A8J4GQ42_9CHLO|nr:hypothetical protein Vretimale_15108 [Volvox reticuliferus]
MTATNAASNLSSLAAAAAAASGSHVSRVARIPACMRMETLLRPALQVVVRAPAGAPTVAPNFPLGCRIQETSSVISLGPPHSAVDSASSCGNGVVSGRSGMANVSGSTSPQELAEHGCDAQPGVSSAWRLAGGWRDGERKEISVRHGREESGTRGGPSFACHWSWRDIERGGCGCRGSGHKNSRATPISTLPYCSSSWVVDSPGWTSSAAAATSPNGGNLLHRCCDGDDVAGHRSTCVTSAEWRGLGTGPRWSGRYSGLCPAAPLPQWGSVRHFHRRSSKSSSGRVSVKHESWESLRQPQHLSRQYRTSPRDDEGLGPPMDVFDRQVKALHRNRSAALVDSADPLLTAVSERLLDRLEDCRRSFPTAVVLGGAGIRSGLPALHPPPGGRPVAVSYPYRPVHQVGSCVLHPEGLVITASVRQPCRCYTSWREAGRALSGCWSWTRPRTCSTGSSVRRPSLVPVLAPGPGQGCYACGEMRSICR